jgi:hypothetical protein
LKLARRPFSLAASPSQLYLLSRLALGSIEVKSPLPNMLLLRFRVWSVLLFGILRVTQAASQRLSLFLKCLRSGSPVEFPRAKARLSNVCASFCLTQHSSTQTRQFTHSWIGRKFKNKSDLNLVGEYFQRQTT